MPLEGELGRGGGVVRHLSVRGVSLHYKSRDAPDMSHTKGLDYVETASKVF